MMFRETYLLMISPDGNHNKYYKMIPTASGSWIAEYGRVGARPQKRGYSASEWAKKYREKIAKGYKDVTTLHATNTDSTSNYAPIKEASVAELIDKLLMTSRQVIKSNYTISSDVVTPQMVQQAQTLLNQLSCISNLTDFNEGLVKLYQTLPRAIVDVQGSLAQLPTDRKKIIQREQRLLDTMRGQVIVPKVTALNSKETILDAVGLKIRPCTPTETDRIKKHLGKVSYLFNRAWKVVNKETQGLFNNYIEEKSVKKKLLLWHGSRTENWWSILQTGLKLRPTNAILTGKMFGYGLYFAPDASKSLGYTSLSGSRWASGVSDTAYMAVINVAYGKPFNVYSWDNKYTRITEQTLQNYCAGANSLHAHSSKGMLRADEIVIYNEAQCTIQYLVELKRG